VRVHRYTGGWLKLCFHQHEPVDLSEALLRSRGSPKKVHVRSLAACHDRANNGQAAWVREPWHHASSRRAFDDE
jgi:hypothetical protein